ncbi:type II secretion system F family protein [Macrococcus hajekii]|uniref:Type II secretion system F family protein n=1 Tax=Macrococcus hajekii TaxID=198482 RepID=A0A4R6BM83_9STAP|nr:competence type IV pilus assembly protein ComGB [Macrococcus hajekii]TDM02916.1 type II secretion system F family protein [Macrococcus hajekii]GGB04861.1 competence protein ComG [Macrococcus hajekii]
MWSSNKLKQYDDDFLIRLSELSDSGFTQYEAVSFLFSQYDSVKTDVKEECLHQLKEGKQLSDILAGLNYSNQTILQVYFAEQYGDINHSLKECYQYSLSQKKSRQQFLKTIQYPLILMIIFFGLIMVVNQTVLPQFKSMYDSMGITISAELQVMTSILFMMPRIIVILFFVIIVLLILYFLVYRRAAIATKLWLLRKIPVINSLYRKLLTYRFSLELSFFLSNGITMLKIIEIFKQQDKDIILKYIGEQIDDALLQGYPLPDAVSRINLFEKSMIHFIHHGERNSRLEIELKYYSDYIFRKFELQIMQYIKWIQPVVFFLLALLIITLYLVIILPMLQMMSGIQ